MHTPFTLTTVYDRTAYRALSEASWQLFMIPRFRARAYPVLLAVDVLLLYTLIFRTNSYPGWALYVGIAAFFFFLAAIPLIALRTKSGVYRKTVADAKKNEMLDETVSFTFEDKIIRSLIGTQRAEVTYEDVVFLAHMQEYYLLFFSQGAYILSTKDLENASSSDLEEFLAKKIGLPMVQMKKKYI